MPIAYPAKLVGHCGAHRAEFETYWHVRSEVDVAQFLRVGVDVGSGIEFDLSILIDDGVESNERLGEGATASAGGAFVEVRFERLSVEANVLSQH